MDYGKKVRIGNFSVLKTKREEFGYIKVSDISGMHSFEVREGTDMFRLLDNASEDKEWHPVLMNIITNVYVTIGTIDADMHRVIQEAIITKLDQIEHTEVDEAKEKEYLDEEKTIYKMVEESKE